MSGKLLHLVTRTNDNAASFSKLQRTTGDLSLSFIDNLADQSPETSSHSKRVRNLCRHFSEKLELSEDERDDLIYAATLHDVGKMYIDSHIIHKSTKLDQTEQLVMATHPSRGAELAEKSGFGPRIVSAILHHHERYDGAGYPNRLVGTNIPLLARIIFLTDTFDTIVSRRQYDPPRAVAVAVAEIEGCAGTQFDPQLAEIFLSYLRMKHQKVLERVKA